MIRQPWTIKEIIDATGGKLLAGASDHAFDGISTDSRNIGSREMFVALTGDRFDGHDFIKDAIRAGVKGVIIENGKQEMLAKDWTKTAGVACVAVDDTVCALGDLARWKRMAWNGKVAAITGSNGKTTTKEMAAGILGRKFSVLSTPGNLNNEIGLPLTLFGLMAGHQWAVLELGMNHPGEISRLAGICQPDIGVITNVGPSHLAGLGTVEAVAGAKGELLGHIATGGTAVLNADDSRVAGLAAGFDGNVLYYGLSSKAAVRADGVETRGHGIRFNLVLPEAKTVVNLAFPGTFMASNALAAASLGFFAGLSAEEIKAGLESVRPVNGRMNIHETGSGVFVVDDSYNANPYSTTAAISALKTMAKNSRCIMVLGDMLELGDGASALHMDVGRTAAEAGFDMLFLCGRYADDVARGARSAGMSPRHICIGEKEYLLDELKRQIESGNWILVKGSRSMHMEAVVQALLSPAFSGGRRK